MSKQTLLQELTAKQLKDVPEEWKLMPADLIRIASGISSSILNPDECSLWFNHRTGVNRKTRLVANYRIQGIRKPLHRILFSNYVKPLKKYHPLRAACGSVSCLNVRHLLIASGRKRKGTA